MNCASPFPVKMTPRRPYFLLLVFLLFLLLPGTRAWAVRLIGLVGYYGLCYVTIWNSSTYNTARKLLFTSWPILLLITLLFGLFGWWYLSLYHFVPTWDQIGYWGMTLDFNQSLDGRPFHTILNALQSVNTQDYNLLQCWIMSLPVKLNQSWAGAFYSEMLLISVPVAFVLASFVADKTHSNTSSSIAIYAFMVANPVLLFPVFDGYLDEVGVLLFACVIAAVFDDGFINRSWDLIVIGAGIVVIVLLRRWFVYGIIPLVAICFAYWIIYLVQNKSQQTLRNIGRCVLKTSIGACVTLMPFYGFVMRSISGGYSEQYRSWTYIDSLSGKVIDTINHFGWIWILLAAFALVGYLLPTNKRSTVDGYPVIILVSLFVIAGACGCLLFWNTQDFSSQHYYFFAPYILVAISIPIATLLSTQQKARAQVLLAVGCSVLSILGCCNALGLLEKQQRDYSLLPTLVLTPPKDSGYDEKYQMVHDLEAMAGTQDGVYFACASLDINYSILNSVSYSERAASTPVNYCFADVDSRDGFNTGFFTCEYVVATNPVSLHMSQNNERVVSTINEGILDPASLIGRHYSLVNKYQISSCEVRIYKLTSSWTYEEVEELAAYFENLYPQWPALFEDRFNEYLSSMGIDS